MAEDLTEYLHEAGIAVRYLHSDIDTVERMEIIRDLRLGIFDVLIGINLLREGLDMPEVALVAILDADKEGFLRSERSLIQTIGRAARNLNGRAILYADRETGSIQRALAETARRRQKQIEFNEVHGITPKGIRKSVQDIMEGAIIGQRKSNKTLKLKPSLDPRFAGLSSQAMLKEIVKLEKQMFQHAKNMEFEQAAEVRDQVLALNAYIKVNNLDV